MRSKKLSLLNVQGKLNRTEMRKITGGNYSVCTTTCSSGGSVSSSCAGNCNTVDGVKSYCQGSDGSQYNVKTCAQQ
jgi:natural product precursor